MILINKKVFTHKEASEWLGISERQLTLRVENGAIRTLSGTGRVKQYSIYDLESYLNKPEVVK